MATMVKEKRREKKKTKQKNVVEPTILEESQPEASFTKEETQELPNSTDELPTTSSLEDHSSLEKISEQNSDPVYLVDIDKSDATECPREHIPVPVENNPIISVSKDNAPKMTTPSLVNDNVYKDLNLKLERISIPATPASISKEREDSLEKLSAYLNEEATEVTEGLPNVTESITSGTLDTAPSAPMLEFTEPQMIYQEQVKAHEVPKLISMPLEEAVQLYGGKEMAEVMAMSEREEAIVEAGDMSGPDHPLVDYLSTFKRSLIAVERERNQLSVNLAEEEKYRETLWKIEKRYINETIECKCGDSVRFAASYEHADFQDDKLPVARLKLESILRDIQQSYCHYQHAAILAACQIDEFISDIIKSGNKNEIRVALSLILQALKLSDNAPLVLSVALRRWSVALATALTDSRDLRQLLYLLHHLFRQTRSVRWAVSAIDLSVTDSVSAARTIALLDILLTRPPLECAVECTEEKDEQWEEVDRDGVGGAVSDGSLRERDMLTLLRAFPLRDLVARLALVTQADLTQPREWQWTDAACGRDVLRACCGVRTLLHVLARAVRAHAHYTRLRDLLRHLALSALRALAALHERNWQSYSKELEVKIQAELEAAFVGGWDVLGPGEVQKLPASLLSRHAARDYCAQHIDRLHDPGSHRVESLSLDVGAQGCGARVAIVTSAAVDRKQDYELARIVLDFLFQTGIRRNVTPCTGTCRQAAQVGLALLLDAHPHLYAIALHLVAETSQVEKLEASSISCLALDKWRPQSGEARAVLDDWARRCPHLLPPLLLNLDYTPHTGLSLETQLVVGSWLCTHAHSLSPSDPGEWCWGVLRKLRVHRTGWAMRPDAPPPEIEPNDLLSKAYALMATSWGHCIPLICSEGVAALCSLAAARVADAVHCLAPIMLLLVDSPESIASTEKFTEFFSLVLNSGPGIMQRALGRGAPSGTDLLTRLIRTQLAGEQCGGVPHTALVRVWTWALWRPALPAAAALLDSVLRPRHCWQLDEFAQQQTEGWAEQMTAAMRMSSQAPLVCYAALRAWLSRCELANALLPRLELTLYAQRAARQKIHVANALKLVGSTYSAEDLVIYRTAAAILSAPHTHAAHVSLWALFMHLYLQRPQYNVPDTVPPVGSLYFSGIIKSRTLAQLKRRLQDTIKFHQSEAKRLLAEIPEPEPKRPARKREKSEPKISENPFLPISIADLACAFSDSSDSECSDEDTTREDSIDEEDNTYRKNLNLTIAYHKAADTMLSQYAGWLDSGEGCVVQQHKADMAHFITDQLQEAACELASPPLASPPGTAPLPLPPSQPPAAPQSPPTPYDTVIDVLINIKSQRRKRSKRNPIKSPAEGIDFSDGRCLLRYVDTHLQDLQKMSKEMSADASTISALNASLWKLFRETRVPRPLQPMQKQCAHKCKPLTFAPPGREWCISVGAVQGVKENRAKALACMRRLARSRPHAGRSAAALLTIARRMRSLEAAKRSAELALQAAPACGADAARATLTTFVEILAERWLHSDGVTCAYLIRRSYNISNVQGLIGCLVAPQRTSASHAAAVHGALLKAPCSPEELFSYLSRFDMNRWADAVGPDARKETLNELTEAARRWGTNTEPEYLVLLELVGMQSAAICRETELCGLVTSCCRAAAAGWLPPPHLPHVTRAVTRCAPAAPFDQLGHLLREVGVVWWEARTTLKVGAHGRHAAYAPHVAGLLSALQRAFVAAAIQLSYAPERVGLLSWSSLVESWSAWVLPHAAAPLLPSMDDDANYTAMLRSFSGAVRQVMSDCPGTEEFLLCQIFEWAIQTHLSVHSAPNHESRVQISSFLAELAAQPWAQYQWIRGTSLQALLQVCQLGDKELGAWCSAACSGQRAATWLRDTDHALLPARLALLLLLFTSPLLQQPKIVEEAERFPWHRLPEVALDEALERFFAQHYSLTVPYHDLPQFRVILAASELTCAPDVSINVSPSGRQKRGRVVSAWVRAAAAPALAAHAPAHARALHLALARAAPLLANSEGELEELLGRALTIMCIEPAATAALPVWEAWLRKPDPVLSGAGVRCARTLTAYEYYAPLADAAVRAYIATDQCQGWSSIASMWADGHWTDAGPLCARGRLFAAYATLTAHAHTPGSLRAALLALVAANVDFVENEAIVATWICAACRLTSQMGFEGAEGEARAASRALLCRWAEPPRRSLLQLVALQTSTTTPTLGHRLLSLFALCVLSRGAEGEARAFEAACSSVPGLSPDVPAWGRAPHPKRLPRLAMRLYPKYEKYLKEELDMAPEDNV